jgi:hypothetical protein
MKHEDFWDPREWLKIEGTGYDVEADRDRFFQDYDLQNNDYGEALQERALGNGRLAAEEQAIAGGEQARRRAKSLSASVVGGRTGASARSGERAGDYAQAFAGQQAQQARSQDQYASQQMLGQYLSARQQAVQQRAELDSLYAKMGFGSALSDFDDRQMEQAGVFGMFGNMISSIMSYRSRGES